jgi:hypothetical protein
MKDSIISLLTKHGYSTEESKNDPYIKEIDKLMENPYLKIEVCKKGYEWKRKNGSLTYNMKFTLYTTPNGFIVDKQGFLSFRTEPISVYHIYKSLNEFLSNKNLKFRTNQDSYSVEDPYSERNIMRDLERGDGDKHGLG